MIRWNGISLPWYCSAFLMVIMAVLAGCDKATPDAAPAQVSAPNNGESSHKPPIGGVAEVVEPDVAASEELAHSEAEHPKPATTEPTPVDAVPAPSAQKQPKVALSVPEPPEYVYEPQVLMSQRDADSCLVKVGDPFPDGQLSDLQGDEHSLKELLGEKLTVVVFWSNANRLGREQIQRLEAETVLPFKDAGVNVVAINIGDSPEQIVDLFPADHELGFTVLLDTASNFFSKLATGRHPRTYLLDAEGNIVWFDLEYSRSTARDLANAVHVQLGDRKFGDS